MTLLTDTATIVLIGAGATLVMDAWLLLRKRMGVRTLDFALLGRWVGHVRRGRFVHAAIADAPPVRGERVLGWLTHYAVGIAFAALLIAQQGLAWTHQATFVPAVAMGAITVVAPLFVMQPAMGAGFAASRTPAPVRNCLRSLANHVVFGVGLYLATVVVDAIAR
jgi:hypothetical protein